jgi:hypothetical protein
MSGKVDPTFLTIVALCSLVAFVLYTHWADRQVEEAGDSFTVEVQIEYEFVEDEPSDW